MFCNTAIQMLQEPGTCCNKQQYRQAAGEHTDGCMQRSLRRYVPSTAVPCNKADLACATKLQQWADYYQDQQGLLLPHAGIGGLEIAKNGIHELEDRSKPTQDRSRGQMLSLAGAGLQ